MIGAPYVDTFCDECGMDVTIPYNSPGEVRARLRQLGWIFLPTNKLLCAMCALQVNNGGNTN